MSGRTRFATPGWRASDHEGAEGRTAPRSQARLTGSVSKSPLGSQAPKPPRAVRLKLAAPWLTRTADWLKTWKALRMSWAL